MGRAVTREMLRKLHRWAGLLLALPVILQAVTGLILVAEPFSAALRGVPSAGRALTAPADPRDIDVAAILQDARAAMPSDLAPRRWRVLPDDIIAIDFATPGRQKVDAQVLVDARSDAVIAVRQNPDIMYRWVHSLHETLLMGLAGRQIIGWIGILLLALAITGVPIWWPPRGRMRAGFTITRGTRGWRFQRDLHGAAGIWMVVLLVLQSISGIALAFPQTVRAFAGMPALVQGQRGARPPADAPGLDPSSLIVAGIAAARAATPNAALQDLRLPPVPGRPMSAVLLPDGQWQGSPPVVVTMDPANARVTSVRDPRTLPPGGSVLEWLRALHEGAALGPLWRGLLTLFALVLPLFPITGLAMWLLRRRTRRRVARPLVAPQAGE